MEFSFDKPNISLQAIKEAFNIRAFLLSFIPMFLMVVLRQLGVSLPVISFPTTLFQSPQPVKADVITPKLQQKTNFYQLHKPVSILPIAYATMDNTLDTTAYSVIDYDNGNIIVEKNGSQKVPVASLTKVMTATVALDLASPDDVFTISNRAAHAIPTHIAMIAGQKMTLSELLHALLMTSANDAGTVIKEGIDKRYGQGTFVTAMNTKANFIGLLDSHFDNPQGFDSQNNYSTANDLAILSHYALTNYPLIAEIAQKDYIELPADTNHKKFKLYNWNGLLDVYPNVEGLKIGNTDAAGKTMIAISTRNDKKILAVLLGAPGVLERDMSTGALLDIGFATVANLPKVNVTEEQLRAKYATWTYGE